MPDWRRIVQNRLAEAGFEGPIESEISDELAFHLERRYAELTAMGMPEGRRGRRYWTKSTDATGSKPRVPCAAPGPRRS